MRAACPPAVATWLLDHLCAERNEALAGDLVEEYFGGRSAGWYWRQVMAAIAIGGAQRVRTAWPEVMFAAFWTAVSPWLRYVQIRMLDDDGAALQRIWRTDGPWATRFDSSTDVFVFLSVLWLGVTLYVVFYSLLGESFDVSRLLRALLLVLPALAGFSVVAAVISAGVSGFAGPVPLLIRMAHGPYGMVFFATAVPLVLTRVRSGRGRGMAIHG
ncbi:hypothetical protein [Acidicapsa acidisoli]|uniref:hypothetical protein n=1 Tax=Acidicapsa acidisoli TaxID=1615681 RepID=UPI0021E03C84|nr:hypothetical protein [Acidicapsa acidisoli]